MRSKSFIFLILMMPLFLFSQATDLFFSEYIEGSSNNKGIEIFNGTGTEVDLSNYRIGQSANGGDWAYWHTFPSGAKIADGDVWVIITDQVDGALFNSADADEVLSYPSVVHHNGNDARSLEKTTDGGSTWTILDVIGVPTEDPGDGWDVAGISAATKDHTLIRKSSVSSGNTDWAASAGTDAANSEWEVHDKNYFADLGQHTFDGGGPVSGDGKGSVTVEPSQVSVDTTVSLQFTFSGAAGFTLTTLQLTVPADWSWPGTSAAVVLSGAPFTSATVSVNGDTLLIQNAALSDAADGTLTLNNMTAPSTGMTSVFAVKTAESGGTLKSIAGSPTVQVKAPTTLVTIADIQNNFASYDGQSVKIEAVVSIGAGAAIDTRTDAYVQDASGRGINIFDFNAVHTELSRGNLVRITGTVGEFSGTTQIENFTLEVLSTGNAIPGIEKVSTLQAGNLDHEGTMIETAGIISDLATGVGGGTNITINDGSGDITIRIWDTSGLNFSDFSVGDTLGVRAVIDQYNGAPQLLAAYQEDLFKATFAGSSDGHGTVSVTPDSVGLSDLTNLAFVFKLSGQDTVEQVELTVPNDWQWSSTAGDVELSGAFSDATPQVNGKIISLSGLLFTAEETGTLTVHNLTSPSTDGSSTFAVRTAAPGGRLTAIEQSPVILTGAGTTTPYISIEEARAKGTGATVTVRGVVTIGAGVLSDTRVSAYMQDETGRGLNIFSFDADDPDIRRGNLILIQGELDAYNGVLELKNYSATVLKTGAAIPGIRKLSTAEASGIDYEGSFIEITGGITDIGYAGGGTNITVNDGSGPVTVRVWDTAGINLSGFEKGDLVTIRGAVSVYSNTGQILLGYAEDIFSPQYDGSKASLTVEAKPFVPDRGETMKIEFGAGAANAHITLRIFDLGGRLVTTLKDGNALPITEVKEWDGLDELGEYVPLGSYLCHLEIINNDTGKRTVKIAPIVIGTVLK